MINYITAVMNEYGDSIYAYDVMNEALGDHDHPYKNIDDFFCKAFKAARAANLTSQLFYNDYNIMMMDGW
jgi:endo-1,4-beta-xylanase